MDSEALEVRYLLGELSEEEAEIIEKGYFADDQAFEGLQIAEAEVIDAYVRGELSADARMHLEKRLAKSPRLSERVAFARTFAKSLSTMPLGTMPAVHPSPKVYASPQSSWWRGLFKDSYDRRPALTLALAACIALFLLGGVAVIVQSMRLRNESNRLEAERAAIARQRGDLNRLSAEQREKLDQIARDEQSLNDRAQELQQRQKASEPPQKTTPILASLMLFPGGLRSGGVKELTLAPGMSGVEIQLVLRSADYPSYRVIIRSPGNKETQRTGLKASSGKVLSLKLSAAELPPGDYAVGVSGVAPSGAVESVSDYVFHVSRK
jgi:anti-sigma factor RsiW